MDTVQAAHFADILVQNIELSETMDIIQAGLALRDKLMSENVMWILDQEKARGNSRIFISGHNGHVDQSGSYDEDNKYMGHYLADEIGEASYFVIGTDFSFNNPNGMCPNCAGIGKVMDFDMDNLIDADKTYDEGCGGTNRCYIKENSTVSL